MGTTLDGARGYRSPSSASAQAPQVHGVEIAMNSTHREIRAKLQSMAPQRAVAYIAALELPSDEAFFLIECDVKGKSYAQLCAQNFVTPEYINRRRRRAYGKIADHIKNL